MFPGLPHIFKKHNVPADIRTLLLLKKSMNANLVRTLGDIYLVLKGLVVKEPSMIAPFTMAFYDYFLKVDILSGETLEEAIARSEAFKDWKEKLKLNENLPENIPEKTLVDNFLNEIHLTSYDIKSIIDGQDILDKDNPDLSDDQNSNDDKIEERMLKAADYNDISLQELLERMKRVAEQQKGKHKGGSHWIGQGGISPYGNKGAAAGGIKVGGQGGSKMARAVIGDSKYYPVDLDQKLSDNNIDAALAALKGVFDESAYKTLDIDSTIKNGLKRGGLFLPEEKEVIHEKLKTILMVDNGGFSMDIHIKAVTSLFKKMKTRFAHDLETYYFHNTIYNYICTDERRTDRISIDRILAKDPDYSVFIIGDAAMAPYELNQNSINHWLQISNKFKKIAWLNPDPISSWKYSHTVEVLSSIFPMYPLTPKGIEKAVVAMNKTNNRIKPR